MYTNYAKYESLLITKNFQVHQVSFFSAWHLIIYAFAAGFGIINYVLLQSTMQLVDNNCILFPRRLSFKMVDVQIENVLNQIGNYTNAQEPVQMNTTDFNDGKTSENDTEWKIPRTNSNDIDDKEFSCKLIY